MKEQLFAEQERVINHNRGNIMVSASAGSGKTFSMIKRLIRLITEGKANVTEILAVTFTEAAAKEMKEKLAKGIMAEIEAGKTQLADQIADLPYADVCTIDSLCSRIVRQYFYRVGVSPDFTIADAAVAEKLRKEAVNKTFKEFYKSENQAFLSLVKRMSSSRQDTRLKELVLSCYEFISTEVDIEKFRLNNLEQYSEKSYRKMCDEFFRIIKRRLELIAADVDRLGKVIAANKAGNEDGFAAIFDSLLAFKNAVLSAINATSYEQFNVLKSVKKPSATKDNKAAPFKKTIDAYIKKAQEIQAEAEDFFTNSETDLARFDELKLQTETFYSVLSRFGEIYSDIKAEENLLDFNDLERFSQKALSDNDVAAAVKAKYKYVFVDEYQDVNGIQEDIITKISNGNLFMVGDVKQSIYAFRGCRSDFFTEKFNLMKNSGQAAEKLNRNFRSAENVIDGVNGIFSFAMNRLRYGENYYPDSQLVYGGKYDGHKGSFNVYRLIEDTEDETPSEEVTEQAPLQVYDVVKAAEEAMNSSEDKNRVYEESRLVAHVIKEVLGTKYYDAEEKREKTVGYGDIAILSRNGIELSDKFVSGLIALGIPVTYDGETSVLNYPEINVLMSLLKIINNFHDDVALATVMKSLFNFTDEELVLIALPYYNREEGCAETDDFAYAVENAENLPDGLNEKVKGFLNDISRLRKLADFLSAEEVLERVISEKNYYAFLMSEKDGEDRVKRVKFFVFKAGEGKNYTVSEFIDLVEKAPRSFKTGGGTSGDAVKFVTIHSSKGLEYPVVIVRHADKTLSAKNDYAKKVLSDRQYGFALKYYDDEKMTEEDTPLTKLVTARLKENFITEEMRLFYVALTRARYSLNITVGKEENFGRLAICSKYTDFLPDDTHVVNVNPSDLISTAPDKPESVIFYKTDSQTVEKMKRDFAYRYPFKEDTLLPLKISVTEAVKNSDFQVYGSLYADEDVSDVTKGNTAHKILELYDFDSRPDVKTFADTLVKTGTLKKEEVDSVDLNKIQQALFSSAFTELNGKKLYREQDFIVAIEGNNVCDLNTSSTVVLQGKIDLLAVDGENAVIIDYKYSAKNGEALRKRYAKQLDLYAYAVKKSLNLNVKGKYIVSLLTGETVKV